MRESGDHPQNRFGQDRQDLNRRYGEYRRRVVGYVRKNYPDVCADDVAQESLERLLRKRYDQDGSRSVDSLLFTIATNIVRDQRRRRRLASHVPPEHQIPLPARSPEDVAMDNEDRRLARQAWQHLRPADRKVIESVYLNDATCVDLSRVVHIPPATMRKRLSRARHRLLADFLRLSQVVLPVGLVAELVRGIRRNMQTVMFTGAAGVATVAAAISVGPGLVAPPPDSGGHDGITSPPIPTTASVSPSSSTPHARPGLDQKEASTAVPGPAGDVSAVSPPRGPAVTSLPVRSGLDVYPGMAAGKKQENRIAADTPLGPVGTDGASRATGPASVAGACGGQPPTSVPKCDSPWVAGADSGRHDPAHLYPLPMAER